MKYIYIYINIQKKTTVDLFDLYIYFFQSILLILFNKLKLIIYNHIYKYVLKSNLIYSGARPVEGKFNMNIQRYKYY